MGVNRQVLYSTTVGREIVGRLLFLQAAMVDGRFELFHPRLRVTVKFRNDRHARFRAFGTIANTGTRTVRRDFQRAAMHAGFK
jgi:hypothetical protein